LLNLLETEDTIFHFTVTHFALQFSCLLLILLVKPNNEQQ